MTDSSSRNHPIQFNSKLEFNTAKNEMQYNKEKNMLRGSLDEVSIPLILDNKIISQKINDVESYELLKSGRNSK